MLQVEELDALDLLLWLGSGSDAAARLGCSQSTISRRTNHCVALFDLRFQRSTTGEPLTNQDDLLTLQRQVHQLHRLRQGSGLRLDASLLAAPLLGQGVARGWLLGHLDGLGWKRPVQLLQERILDAWITAMGQELTAEASADLCCVPLLRCPLQLAAERDHPLLLERGLRLSDVERLPRLAPPQGCYPRTEQLLGPWRRHSPPLPLRSGAQQRLSSRRQQQQRQGPLLHYGTAFSLGQQRRLRPLPLDLGVQTELTLVMRSDVREQAPMAALIKALQARVAALHPGGC